MDSPSKLLQNGLLATKKLAFILMALPLCATLLVLKSKQSHLQNLKESVTILEKKAALLQKEHEAKELRWALVTQSPPDHLSHAIEALPLLSQEKKQLALLSRKYPDNIAIRNRLAFLQSGKNKIHFTEEAQRSGGSFHEKEVTMAPVQMSPDDLRGFLEKVEGTTDPKPLYIIKDFSLKKEREEVYSVQASLIVRTP
jgi:hypothetical protein